MTADTQEYDMSVTKWHYSLGKLTDLSRCSHFYNSRPFLLFSIHYTSINTMQLGDSKQQQQQQPHGLLPHTMNPPGAHRPLTVKLLCCNGVPNNTKHNAMGFIYGTGVREIHALYT